MYLMVVAVCQLDYDKDLNFFQAFTYINIYVLTIEPH